MKPKVVIIGANGHAKVILDIIRSADLYDIVGCTDINQSGTILGAPIIGDDSILPKLFNEGVTCAFVALGDNQLRKKKSGELQQLGFALINAISPYSYVSSSVKIGNGTVIMPGAVVNADSVIGHNVIINTGATVDHDCRVEDYAHVAPGSNLAGNVQLGEGVFLGVGTKVIPGITIGQWAVVGAGGVVVKDIPEKTTSVGVPARFIK